MVRLHHLINFLKNLHNGRKVKAKLNDKKPVWGEEINLF